MTGAKVGLYLRLSREDDDRESESQSILNQRALLTQYCTENGFAIAEIYIDDGYSGTNFDRPAFRRMLADIEAGRLDTVIVKDHSRLGRDYIESGRYVERYFPEHRVRYIAVGDRIDTGGDEFANDMAPFLAVFNDRYAKDISRKVRAALTAKKRAGQFIGAIPPFGYCRDTQQKGLLVIDEQAAEIVREIFRLYLCSGSVSGTAKLLTERHAPTPSAYRGLSRTQRRTPGVWSDQMVRRILTNPTYAGNLTQNRARKLSYKLTQRAALPASEWITVEGTHEGIVSEQTFARAQQQLMRRTYGGGRSAQPHLLTGLAFCADCGSPMTYVRESPTRTYMVCQTYRKGGRLKLCTSHSIREDHVIEAVRDSLRQLVEALPGRASLCAALVPPQAQAREAKALEALRQKLTLQYDIQYRLYEDRAAGRLTDADYAQLFVRTAQACEQLAERIRAGEKRCAEQGGDDGCLRVRAEQFLQFEALSRGTVHTLLDRLYIQQDKGIEIIFKFQKPQ